MRDRMAHRGPDGCGLWGSRDRRCRLGHRRLSIIDLSDAAAQPMTNRGGHGGASRSTAKSTTTRDLRRELQALGKYDVEDRSLRHRGAAARLRGVGAGLRQAALRHVRARDLRRARSGPAGPAPDSRSRRHQADVFHPDARRRVAVRLGDSRDRRPSRHHAGNGSDRLLALPHVHRRAGAADDVPRHLQAARRPHADDRPRRRGRRAGGSGTARRIARRR